MRKIVTVFLLLVFIGIIFSYVILRIGFLGSEDNFFNRRLRPNVSRSFIFRQIFGLHFDGDAKMDYLGNGYDTILIEVDSMDKYNLKLSTLDLVAQKIQEITKKRQLIFFPTEVFLIRKI